MDRPTKRPMDPRAQVGVWLAPVRNLDWVAALVGTA